MKIMNFKLFGIAAIASLSLVGCKVESSTSEKGQQEQERIMQRATSAVPTYHPNNFLTRRAVDKWMRRMDVPDKTFYIYILGDNGSHIGYYVGQTRPISSCTLLTPPQRLENGEWGQGYGDFVMDAPSLDGVYGGGGCDTSFFFFDAETDALIELQGMDFFTADQPLSVNAEPITIRTE